MNRQEAARLAGVLSAAYTNWNPPKETIAVYAAMLADLDASIAGDAVAAWVKESRFPPTVAELRDAYKVARESRQRALPSPHLPPDPTPAERAENLRLMHAYMAKIGRPVTGGAA